MRLASLCRAVGLAALLPAAAGAACSSASPSPNGGDGVDDVTQACTLRAQWQSASSIACATCLYEVPVAACSCDSNPERGLCYTQAKAMGAEADCSQAIAMCVDACAAGDCTCVSGCYTGHDACRSAASAYDGCVVAVCGEHCQ